MRRDVIASLSRIIGRRDLMALLAIAVLVRVVYLCFMVAEIGGDRIMQLAPDTIRYVNIGNGIIGDGPGDEEAMIIFGPGYGFFLGLIFFLFGASPYPVLVLQIILSGLGCLFVYKLGKELTDSKAVGLTAGYLAAVSFTSISLANFILSDCLFFFLFLLGNLLFLLGMRRDRSAWYIASGLSIGAAVLVRSIGQFWPAVMVLLILILPRHIRGRSWFADRLKLLKKAYLAPLIALIIMGGWMARNQVRHDIPFLAFTSAGGPANLAVAAVSRMESKDPGQIREGWLNDYRQAHGLETLTLADQYRAYTNASRETFLHYPWPMLDQYRKLIWENISAVNELYRVQLPVQENLILDNAYWLRDFSLQFAPFWLSLASGLVLLVLRRWRPLLFLGATYLYFVLMIGFTQWQGSRLFYPGQIAWSVAIAFLFTVAGAAVNKWTGRFLNDSQKPAASTNHLSLDQRLTRFVPNLAQALQVLAERKAYVFLFTVPLIIGVIILYWKIIVLGLMPAGTDTLGLGVFSRSFLVTSILSGGGVPGWNPYLFCGLPFVDAIHGDMFYPLSFLKFLLSIPAGIGWTFVMHIILAGVTAYLAARQLGLSRPAASFAGLSYAFSGWLNSQVAPGHDSKIYVTALFPLIILFIHRAFQRKAVLYYTLAGLVMGGIILSPHPQMAFFSLGAMAAYGLYLMLTNSPSSGRVKFLTRHSALLVYTVIVGMMLGAIQLLPAYDYVRNSSPRTLYANEYYYHSFSSAWSLHPEEVVALVVPEFCGVNTAGGDGNYWGRNGTKDNSEYAGLIPLLLAGIGLLYGRHRDRYFFAALAAAVLLYAVGGHTPFFRYVYTYVPFIRFTRAPSMIMFLFSVAVSLLGAMGVEALLQRHLRGDWGRMKFGRYGLLFVSAGLAILAVLFTFQGRFMFELYGRFLYHSLPGDSWRMARVESYAPIVGWGCAIAAVWAAAVTAAVWLAGRRMFGYLALSLLPLLAVADGVRFDTRFIRTADPKTILAAGPEVEFIVGHQGYERAFGFALNEGDWQFAYHGIYSPVGYHGNELVRYHRLLNYGRGIAANFINPRFVNLVGTKYIMAPDDAEFASVGYGDGDLKKAGVFDKIAVWENLHRFPRAFLVGKYRVVTDPDSICRLIYDGHDNLREMTYLDKAPDEPVDSIVSPLDTAAILSYTTDSVTIRANCQSPKILVLTDGFYKDWHVYINGREKQVMRVYGVFRGVVVGPGENQIVWKYHPRMYHIGRIVTLLGLALIGTVVLVDRVRRRRTAHRVS